MAQEHSEDDQFPSGQLSALSPTSIRYSALGDDSQDPSTVVEVSLSPPAQQGSISEMPMRDAMAHRPPTSTLDIASAPNIVQEPLPTTVTDADIAIDTDPGSSASTIFDFTLQPLVFYTARQRRHKSGDVAAVHATDVRRPASELPVLQGHGSTADRSLDVDRASAVDRPSTPNTLPIWSAPTPRPLGKSRDLTLLLDAENDVDVPLRPLILPEPTPLRNVTLAARNMADAAAKQLSNAVYLRRHAWLRTTNIPDDAWNRIEDSPFDGEGLFATTTDESLDTLVKMRKTAKSIAYPFAATGPVLATATTLLEKAEPTTSAPRLWALLTGLSILLLPQNNQRSQR
ncbi:hypothetical protein JRQ81_016674 [Phrynocephalus forsythii]|uniref:Uncharacterized protein n=1 Tax=Phrynocephalus forsythii TaxID=171643 RepID=A0A9Q1B1P4_9SAUR|nr:hypothetical protein JRQ81_016674 [Phrynocephalus forsythii]